MELEKFHVHDFRACPESERYSVTCSYFGVSGEFEELPRTSGGQYQVSAFKALDPAGQCIEGLDSADSAFFQDDSGRKAVFEDWYLCSSDLGAQRSFYLRPGGVSPCVQDAGHAVCGFARECDLAVKRVEGHSEFHQVGYAVWSFVGEDADGFLVAEPRTCRNRVLVMEFRGVLDADGGRDAALGMARIAVVDAALGHEQDGAMLFGEKRAVQPCDAAADYDIVVLFNIGSSLAGGLFGWFVLFLRYGHPSDAYRRA